MAPRRKSITGAIRGSLIVNADKENVYLRSLSDYQTRVRRRESIRSGKNVPEYDLERKIELEIKMREGSSRLLAAARHPAQSLEAARTLLTSNERMSAYMAELQHRKADKSAKASVPGSGGKLSISDLRFPLMWRDTDHFKNRGDYRRFAVFCLARVGTEIHDTSLLCPIDREHTDISFPDVLVFNNVPAEFELILEIYGHVLQEDLSIASTPRRIRRSIHTSISRTVGKRLAASLRDELGAGNAGPRFDLVARATMSLDDTDNNVRTHDLVIQHNFESKHQALPLFGHFCCRLAVLPDSMVREVCAGTVKLGDRHYWARVRGFRLEAWESKKLAEDGQDAVYAVPLVKNTSVRRERSLGNEVKIVNSVDGTEESHHLELETTEESERWFERLKSHILDHSRWKHAAEVAQQIPSIESSRTSFVDGNARRQGSLYDETPLIEDVSTECTPSTKSTVGQATFVAPPRETDAWHILIDRASTLRPRTSSSHRKCTVIPLKSHWTFSNKN